MTKIKQILGIFAILLITSQAHAFENKDKKNKIQNIFRKNTKIEPKKKFPATVNVDKNFNKKIEPKKTTVLDHATDCLYDCIKVSAVLSVVVIVISGLIAYDVDVFSLS